MAMARLLGCFSVASQRENHGNDESFQQLAEAAEHPTGNGPEQRPEDLFRSGPPYRPSCVVDPSESPFRFECHSRSLFSDTGGDLALNSSAAGPTANERGLKKSGFISVPLFYKSNFAPTVFVCHVICQREAQRT
jgi:hypothetical protein